MLSERAQRCNAVCGCCRSAAMRGARRAAAARSVLPARPALGASVLHRLFNGSWFCSRRRRQGEDRLKRKNKSPEQRWTSLDFPACVCLGVFLL